jgi:hypothetical protein
MQAISGIEKNFPRSDEFRAAASGRSVAPPTLLPTRCRRIAEMRSKAFSETLGRQYDLGRF